MDKRVDQTELRVLLLEDEPTDAELVENELREAGLRFTARRVDTRDTFIQALDEFKPDIVLADYRLPSFDGGSAVKIVRKEHPEIPVVMVTGAVGDEKAVELLSLGAKDYILKDRLARLAPAVQRALSAEQGIRARKAAEKALRHSEERFRSVFENVKDVILTLSSDGILTMLNPAFEQITGWTCAEWLGKSFSSLVHPDDLPNAIHLLQRALGGEALPVFELRILKKTGGCVVGEITLAPLLHDGANAYLLGTARDVTERKQAEDRIRESEAKFRAVVETTSDWIWEINEQGVYSFSNPRVHELLGFTPDEVTGKTPFDLMPAEEAARVSAAFSSIVAERRAFRILENTCLHKDGHAVVLETSGVPVFDGSGVFRGYRGIDRDITERKETEAALARNARELGERVKEIRCLYDITNLLLNKERSVAEVLDACTQRIPGGLLDPSHTCARIRLGADTFETASFRETEWKLAAAIPVFGMEPGLIEVFYFGETAAGRQSPFLEEEANLIQSISTQIAQSLERRQAEKRIQKLTRLYATLSQTNQAIVRTANREELFSGICESAVNHGRFVMAWVGLVDESTRRVKPVCHFGNEAGYLDDMVISTDDVPAGRGPTGASIRGNCVSFVNDYSTDERTLPWREAALNCGFRGAAGVPLRFRNKVIGALTLYTDELNYFDTEQVSLLEEMAIDIGYALDNFAREGERKQAEIRLTEQLNELRRWHEATLGREMRILELKHEVNELLAHSGKPLRYPSAEQDDKGNTSV